MTAAAITVPDDSMTSKPKLPGSLATAAIPNMINSDKLHNDTSAELTEATILRGTACNHHYTCQLCCVQNEEGGGSHMTATQLA